MLLKLDVEGDEFSLLPHLVATSALCITDYLIIPSDSRGSSGGRGVRSPPAQGWRRVWPQPPFLTVRCGHKMSRDDADCKEMEKREYTEICPRQKISQVHLCRPQSHSPAPHL